MALSAPQVFRYIMQRHPNTAEPSIAALEFFYCDSFDLSSISGETLQEGF